MAIFEQMPPFPPKITMQPSSKPPELSARQQQLLEFLRHELQSQGVMPSSREVQQHFGFASQTAAMDLLRALERKGVIRRLPGKARAVILVAPDEILPVPTLEPSFLRIPIYGSIAAGMPQEESADSGRNVLVDFASFGLSERASAFALEVRGDSMVDAHIVPGDLVILEMKAPRSGDVVAALIDGESTLKRYLTRSGIPYLKAENAAYPDLLPAQELIVQGVMVGLMRRPGHRVGQEAS